MGIDKQYFLFATIEAKLFTSGDYAEWKTAFRSSMTKMNSAIIFVLKNIFMILKGSQSTKLISRLHAGCNVYLLQRKTMQTSLITCTSKQTAGDRQNSTHSVSSEQIEDKFLCIAFEKTIMAFITAPMIINVKNFIAFVFMLCTSLFFSLLSQRLPISFWKSIYIKSTYRQTFRDP